MRAPRDRVTLRAMGKGLTQDARPEVSLREFDMADLSTLYAQQLDAEANRMAVANARDADEFRAHWERVRADPEVRARVIVSGAAVLGSINCFKYEARLWVGYWIGKEYWGRGVASRALQLFLREVDARPIHARVARSNLASLRVLERSGFRVTGYAHSVATERFPACEEALLVLDAEA